MVLGRVNRKPRRIMFCGRWLVLVLRAGAGAVQAEDTGTDPAYKHAWGENVGWANAAPTTGGVLVHYYEDSGGWLSGYAWGENIGWIVMGSAGGGPYANTSASDWGVNLAADGKLSGYAWGENIGWINFSHTQCDAAINPANGEFSGHAWGENIGWLKFKGTALDYGVRALAFDTQPQGTPNWWLDHHGVTEGFDAGDGVAAWRKYVMDVDPNLAGNFLRLTTVSSAPAGTEVAFTPASTRRYYTLAVRTDMAAGGWSNVTGQVAVSYGTAGEQTMQDTNPAPQAFYRMEVTVTP